MKKFFLLIVFTTMGYFLWSDAQPCTAVCVAPSTQTLQQVVPDGVGGAIVAWQDYRNGIDDNIYAQRIDTYGNMLWGPNGILICSAPNTQGHVCITPSGGNFILAWEDSRVNPLSTDIYAQKIDINGNILWPFNGIVVCFYPAAELDPKICPDGAGGAFITWYENRAQGPMADYDIYAMRVDNLGNLIGGLNGTLVSISFPGINQYAPEICMDNMGGAIITY